MNWGFRLCIGVGALLAGSPAISHPGIHPVGTPPGYNCKLTLVSRGRVLFSGSVTVIGRHVALGPAHGAFLSPTGPATSEAMIDHIRELDPGEDRHYEILCPGEPSSHRVLAKRTFSERRGGAVYQAGDADLALYSVENAFRAKPPRLPREPKEVDAILSDTHRDCTFFGWGGRRGESIPDLRRIRLDQRGRYDPALEQITILGLSLSKDDAGGGLICRKDQSEWLVAVGTGTSTQPKTAFTRPRSYLTAFGSETLGWLRAEASSDSPVWISSAHGSPQSPAGATLRPHAH